MTIEKPAPGALIEAIIARDVSYTRRLLEQGANPNETDEHNEDPLANSKDNALITAVSSGVVEIAELLLKHGADVNLPGEFGTTAAMYAAIRTPAMLRLMLDAGADIHAVDESGYTVKSFVIGSGFRTEEDRAECIRIVGEALAKTPAPALDEQPARQSVTVTINGHIKLTVTP